jgi:hypothetical protein
MAAASLFIPSGAVWSKMLARATKEFALAPDKASRWVMRVRFSGSFIATLLDVTQNEEFEGKEHGSSGGKQLIPRDGV